MGRMGWLENWEIVDWLENWEIKHVCWLQNRDSQSRRFAPYFSDQIAYPLSFNALDFIINIYW